MNFKYEMIDCCECGGKGQINMGRNLSDTGWCYDDCAVCNGSGKGKILSDYIIVTDPKVAVEFLGKEVIFVTEKDGKLFDHYKCILDLNNIILFHFAIYKGIKIHKLVVKEVCEPKEDDAFFILFKVGMQYVLDRDSSFVEGYKYIKANALTTGLTVGELKELIEWYNSIGTANNG